MFSSRCATDEVPGIGSIIGERRSSHASASCAGVAPVSGTSASSGSPGLASSPVGIGYHGMKPMPWASQ